MYTVRKSEHKTSKNYMTVKNEQKRDTELSRNLHGGTEENH